MTKSILPLYLHLATYAPWGESSVYPERLFRSYRSLAFLQNPLTMKSQFCDHLVGQRTTFAFGSQSGPAWGDGFLVSGVSGQTPMT
jgi:hypothetical protein